ncbi:MAG: hypothetical protein U0269_28415 [Polyangiales bacterium]
MNEHPPLPELETGELDEPTLDRLFDDIARDAQIVAVLLKGGAEVLAEGGGVTLAEAREKLRSRSVRGVQLRYRYGGEEWWDTLIAASDRVRIVRMRAPAE